jgi:hypothetical protein
MVSEEIKVKEKIESCFKKKKKEFQLKEKRTSDIYNVYEIPEAKKTTLN